MTWQRIVAASSMLAIVLAAAPGESWASSAVAPPHRLEVQEIVLDNGFRVLVVEDRRVPRVAASLWYRVGSMSEAQGEHGSAHFLEHVVHQGTTSVGTKDFAAERSILEEIFETEAELIAVRNRDRNRLRERRVFYDELGWPTTPEMDQLRQRLYELEDRDSDYREFWTEYLWYRRNGGLMRHNDPVPATTFKEHIEIDVDLPKENLELFFRMEADRMVNAVLRGWEAQRFTVLEQRLNRQSRPATRFDYEALDGVTFLANPVGHPAGGHLRDFAYFHRGAMLEMYDRFFVPNNATLALVGDVAVDEVRSWAERYFGRVPRGAEPPARMDMEAEPIPGGAVRLDWMEPLGPRVIVSYRMPGIGHPDRPVFDLIAALARGHSSPGQEWIEIEASSTRVGTIYPIRFEASGRRDEDVPLLERALLAMVEDLRDGKKDEGQLERARRALRLDWARLRADRDDLAHLLGSFSVMDGWKTLSSHMEAREGATREDIRRVAQQYFVPANRVIATARANPDVTHGTNVPGTSR